MPSALDRRSFLRGAAAGSLGAVAQAAGLTTLARSARALTCPAPTTAWGDLSTGSVTSSVGAPWDSTNLCYKILEINLPGGASQWETLWLSDSAMLPGSPDFTANDLGLLPLDNVMWTGNGGFSCSPNTGDPALPVWQQVGGTFQFISPSKNYRYFGNDIHTKIYWGAPAKPLWSRNDILSRSRMVTQYHDLAPHEAAIPYGLTGLRLGNGRMAGTGAAIEHRAQSVANALGSPRTLPAAYILHYDSEPAAAVAAIVGQHGGQYRPLVIRVQKNDDFYGNLGRTGITAESDNLFLALRHEYHDRMLFQGNVVRSAGFDGYWSAAERLANARNLQNLFAGQLLDITQHETNVKVCPTLPSTIPFEGAEFRPGVKTMLNAAATLLSGPAGANYVCVLDRGLAGDYDTHGDNKETHLQRVSANLYDLFKQLAEIIVPSGPAPAGKISLDDTMVVVTTEFGRTNYLNGRGRDHFPWGYVALLIGGPLKPTGTNNGTIAGGLDQSNGNASVNCQYTPTDVRGAMLLAAGIDPFATGNFVETDFSTSLRRDPATGNLVSSQADIRNRLRSAILGQ